jgi:hypothetical protein
MHILSSLWFILLKVMLPDLLRRFEDDSARKEGRIAYARSMKRFRVFIARS